MIRRILSAFQLVLAQSERDGERFHILGAKNVALPGNLKFASGPLPVDERALAAMQTQVGERPHWLAASTHVGEEAICARVHKHLKADMPNLLTIIVPRHPERGAEISQELRQMGLNIAQRSAADAITPDTDVYVADTLGEMGLFYRLNELVFIGKSMAGVGGQNPIEPAQLSCAMVFGPDMSNFEDSSYKLTGAGGAFRAQDEQDLGETIKTLLNDEQARHNAAQAAQHMAQSEAHVLDRVMDCLAPYLKGAESGDNDART